MFLLIMKETHLENNLEKVEKCLIQATLIYIYTANAYKSRTYPTPSVRLYVCVYSKCPFSFSIMRTVFTRNTLKSKTIPRPAIIIVVAFLFFVAVILIYSLLHYNCCWCCIWCCCPSCCFWP